MLDALEKARRQNEEDQRRQMDLERKAARMERMVLVGRMVGRVAHEICNPLDGAKKCIEILMRQNADAARVHEMLPLIRDGLNRIEKSLTNLLLFQPGRSRLRGLYPRDFVDAAASLVRTEAQDASVEIRIEAADNLPPVQGDPADLAQVCLVLLLRAVSRSPAGSVVLLRLEQGNDAGRDVLVLTVRDGGGELGAAEMAHIFDPFDAESLDKWTSGGVGLAAVRRIVGDLGGRMDVGSEAGSPVCVRLLVFGGDMA